MTVKFLLTSFSTWLPHQLSNSSDNLLLATVKGMFSPHIFFLLRQLPVNTEQASQLAIAQMKELQPDIIICCGMAEGRKNLTVESNATCGDSILKTSLNLELLIQGLDRVKISHDAGKFVCEGLYYSVLKEIGDRQLPLACLFVHVPVLTPYNSTAIVEDFKTILNRLGNL